MRTLGDNLMTEVYSNMIMCVLPKTSKMSDELLSNAEIGPSTKFIGT